jgi:hypothetical protein
MTTYDEVRRSLYELEDREELLMIAKIAQARADQVLKPTHVIRLPHNARPLYLDGTRGTIGEFRYTRNGRQKVEFMPEMHSRAYDRSRGRPWKISARNVYSIETGESLVS